VATGHPVQLLQRQPPQIRAGADLRDRWGAVALIAQSRIAIALSPIWLRSAVRVFALYPLGPIGRSGGAAHATCAYKQGDLRRACVGRPVTREPLVERKEQGPMAGPTGAGGEPPHLALAFSRRRGGLPWARCVSRWDKKPQGRSAKDANPCLVLMASGLTLTDRGPSATLDPWPEASGFGSTRFCCGQPLRSSASAACAEVSITSVRSETMCYQIYAIYQTKVTIDPSHLHRTPPTDRAPDP